MLRHRRSVTVLSFKHLQPPSPFYKNRPTKFRSLDAILNPKIGPTMGGGGPKFRFLTNVTQTGENVSSQYYKFDVKTQILLSMKRAESSNFNAPNVTNMVAAHHFSCLISFRFWGGGIEAPPLPGTNPM